MYDFIIIGQGLAGTMIAHFLQEEGQSIMVFDSEKHTASFAAAGIVNPVTGRHYVKSWLIETLLPFAKNTYDDLGQKLGIVPYQELNILRTLHSVQEENDWMARLEDEQYQGYLLRQSDASCLKNIVKNKYTYGEITSALQVKLKDIILGYRKLIKSQDRYEKKEIISSDINYHQDSITIDQYEAKALIFCEGYKAIHNPLFSNQPFQPAKGNALIIKGDFHLEKNLRDKIFITPLGNGFHWVGSGYQFNIKSEIPDDEQLKILKNTLDNILSVPYTIVETLAGIRPSIKTRKPLVGRHPSHSNVYLFNGLGTKGSSLAPYFANQLVRHILKGDEILSEVKLY
jgi:glycine/D-amino acid oxidase-like deaminating enzyme